MQNEHRAAIQKNFSSLVEQTDLDTMVSTLYEKGVFSEQMIEPYKDQSKDQRSRKRQLYMDITRRGPAAFGHLVDALTETGCWHLVRELEPGVLPAARPPLRPPPPKGTNSNDSEFVSLSKAKKTGVSNPTTEKKDVPPPPAPPSSDITDKEDIPKFNVIKSTKFMEENEDIKLYRTRGRQRGVLAVFSFIEFESGVEEHRRGADVDCQKLKYLFSEFGFKVISFQNLTKKETVTNMRHLSIERAESVFIVVSSHGYARAGSWDTDIRCSDGGLISSQLVIDQFNNEARPELRGIPKVFIFQMCRGQAGEQPGAAADGAPFRAPRAPRAARAPRAPHSDRVYSDILIAHSTLPGYVSHRHTTEGSWYIAALCEVFAAQAHRAHVDTLLTLVDQALHERFGPQTSDVQKWGFNGRLYLHPGLFEE